MLTVGLTDDALDEYYSHVKDMEEYGYINNASKRAETPEFCMIIENKWANTKLHDVEKNGETLQKTFERLKLYAIRLQKTLGLEDQSNAILCDIFRRALQDELFWGWVDDYEPNVTADKMCGKILNSTVKHERLQNSKLVTGSSPSTI